MCPQSAWNIWRWRLSNNQSKENTDTLTRLNKHYINYDFLWVFQFSLIFLAKSFLSNQIRLSINEFLGRCHNAWHSGFLLPRYLINDFTGHNGVPVSYMRPPWGFKLLIAQCVVVIRKFRSYLANKPLIVIISANLKITRFHLSHIFQNSCKEIKQNLKKYFIYETRWNFSIKTTRMRIQFCMSPFCIVGLWCTLPFPCSRIRLHIEWNAVFASLNSWPSMMLNE